MYWWLILFCHLLSLKTFTQYLTEFKAYTEDKELNIKMFLCLQPQTVLCRNSDESDETEMKRVNMGKCRPVTMERGGKMETLQMKSYSEGWRKIVKRSSLGDTSGWWYHQVRWENRKKTSLGEKWNLFENISLVREVTTEHSERDIQWVVGCQNLYTQGVSVYELKLHF